MTESQHTSSHIVRKRDGVTLQPFDVNKIKRAITAAWKSSKEQIDEKSLQKILQTVMLTVNGEILNVEDLQDAVETSLMRHGKFAVAKSYIVYRHERDEARANRNSTPDTRAISDYIHAGKYAKYIPELGRREIYNETVARTEQMHVDRFPAFKDEIRAAFKLVHDKRVLPSMRSMQFGGPAVLANHNRIYNCSFTLVDRFDAFSEALFLLLCGCGVGYSVQFDHVEKLPPIQYIDKKKVRHHIIEDSIEGWSDALKALIVSYQDKVNLEFSYHKVRPAGSPLKTSGGRAPGHLKLKESLERIRTIFNSAQGRNLRPVECHRIMCHIADAVLSGGIRRSAMICLFSLDDSEMMYVKTGNWSENEPWLANANNSVVLKRDEVKKKQFKRIFKMTKEWGEPGFYFTNDYDYGTNPCVTGDTIVETNAGPKTVKELAEENANFFVKSYDEKQEKIVMKSAIAFKTKDNAKILQIRTKSGKLIKLTPDHRVYTQRGWIEAGSLTNEDKILTIEKK